MNENFPKLLKKITEIRERILQVNLKKSGHNKFSNFHYYELQDILPDTIKLEKEIGLMSIFNEITKDEATLTIYDTETGQSMEVVTTVEKAEIKGALEIQKLGSQHTYLKRYSYLNYLNLTENDSVDRDEEEQTKTKSEVPFKQPLKEKDNAPLDQLPPKQQEELTPDELVRKYIPQIATIDKLVGLVNKYGFKGLNSTSKMMIRGKAERLKHTVNEDGHIINEKGETINV